MFKPASRHEFQHDRAEQPQEKGHLYVDELCFILYLEFWIDTLVTVTVTKKRQYTLPLTASTTPAHILTMHFWGVHKPQSVSALID